MAAVNPPPVAPQIYQDFEPHTQWSHEPKWDTLIVHLPGFRTEKLRVQVTSDGKLRISGEQHLVENKWHRFLIEFPIPSNCDVNRITAKYEGGMLYVRQPKTNAPPVPVEPPEKSNKSQEEPKPQTAPPPKPDQKPPIEAQEKKNDEEHLRTPNEMVPEKSDVKRSSAENGNKNNDEEKRPGRSRVESYRKVAGDLAMEMKKARNLVKLAVVVLLVFVLFLYPIKTRNSIGGSADLSS